MNLLRTLHLALLFTSTLATAPQSLHLLELELSPNTNIPPPIPNALLPRVPPAWISTQSTGAHVSWGHYAITFWKSTAILPVVAAAQPLRDFYQKATLAAIQAIGAKVVANSYTVGIGALNLHIDTLDRSPIEWEMVVAFAGNMVGATNRGWTAHYAAVVRNTVSGVLTVVSLEAAGGAVGAWLSGGSGVEQFRNDPFGS